MSKKQVSTAQKKTDITTWLDRPEVNDRLAAALRKTMSVSEFKAQLVIEFQKPDFRNCTPESKFKAAHLCAQLALLPSFKEVAIYPYGDELTAVPQWQGFKSIMMRHPDVEDVEARLVFVGDKFDFDGKIHEVVDHQYDPFTSREVTKDLANLRGGYLEIKFINGRTKFHFSNVEYIKKCRACAQSKNIWDKWTTQQCLKTVYRDAFARRVCPTDANVTKYLQEAIDYEDVLHQNDPDYASAPAPLNLEDYSRELKGDAPKKKAPPNVVDGSVKGKDVEPEKKTPKDIPGDTSVNENVKFDHSQTFDKCNSPEAVTDLLSELIPTAENEHDQIAMTTAATKRTTHLMEELDRMQSES